jgi:glutamate dehydrogenase/leucine dehydrogenase
MRTITLNLQQQREVEILTRLEAGVLDVETAAKLGLSEGRLAILETPERELTVAIPIRMDDETIRVFKGYRIQHSSVSWPVQGRDPLPPGC